MSSLAWQRRPDGLVLRDSKFCVRLAWQAPGIVRVAAVPVNAGEPGCAYGPMLDPLRRPQRANFDIREAAGEIVTTDGVLSVHIDTGTGVLSYRDRNGEVLLREGERVLEPRPLAGEGFRAKLPLRFGAGEALYGLGQHEDGRLNYRGRTQELYQHNLKVPVPLLVSSRGWGLLWHGYSAMTFDDRAEVDSYLAADCVAEMDYFVIAGEDLDGVICGYRDLTGGAPLPPRWAFGYLQSKERYQTQEELLETAHRYAELGLPLEAIVLDWQYWPDDLWGQKSLDPKRFPDPEQMCQELHDLGTRLIVSVWPEFDNDGPDQTEFRAGHKLLGNGRTYDAFDPEARAMFWRQAHDGLFTHGVDGWWSDSAEPFQPDWHGELPPDPDSRRQLNVATAERYLGPAVSNAYPLMHNSGFWDGQRASGSSKRVFVLTRSAWAGQQRYGTCVWSGDITASWETLRRQIPEGLNFCASGMPYWNCDIGGFFVASREQWFWRGEFDDGVSDPAYRELFLRWFQYATFLPAMRAHGTDTPREIWHYGRPGTPVYDALVRHIKLRKDLLPYLYSLAASVHFDGYTMMRALAFDFPGDANVLDIEDQFMLGPALLVCPVTRPGSTHRAVYLPAGTGWVNVWDGSIHKGGRWIDAPAPAETIPVFARAGSIVPMKSGVRVFPGADGAFKLYEDAGDGWGYESGDYERFTLEWRDAQRTLVTGARSGKVRAGLVIPGTGWQSPLTGKVTVRSQ
ncbi:glycoside hydrolase family 31 protein [Catelliglobosispora koreensis]|uniref:glycoside hydrolase family 31 protein n=1 Tax=Catelliglobosispora koreensis TaxID=129052 RepID=UPI00036D76C9|nr:TIM-barrel domain-containing protein [Catelliglobosispora koreensis]